MKDGLFLNDFVLDMNGNNRKFLINIIVFRVFIGFDCFFMFIMFFLIFICRIFIICICIGWIGWFKVYFRLIWCFFLFCNLIVGVVNKVVGFLGEVNNFGFVRGYFFR